jgi:hypothetical protein
MKRANSSIFHFTCIKCGKYSRSKDLTKALCSDCKRYKNKQVESLSNGFWLEWINLGGKTYNSRRREYFVFLDLFKRNTTIPRQEHLLHFVWEITFNPISMWYGGMVRIFCNTFDEAINAAERERDRLIDDIKKGIYKKWVGVCPVCNVVVDITKYPDFDCTSGKCSQCGRIWLKWG